ncbi:DciA family protein [Treponema parvum]|uniref:DciA family protein n=1 Tax=Treponema parvum TaxID=138851 RepID=UPI001AEBB45B|nr:DciA family protein [Treponema parvum]QTQ15217.1 DUF721 domain-containing protein [Treponema parvum]
MNGNFKGQVINCGDMIMDVFSSIDKEKYKEKEDVSEAWKTITRSVKKGNSQENLGEKLYSHSSLVEIKNGILLVETDHPAYIQLFRMYERYILKGLKQQVPQLDIRALSFRLKGSAAVLSEKENKREYEEKLRMEKEFEREEKILKDVYKDEKINENKEIPSEIIESFNRIKKNMLTKRDN